MISFSTLFAMQRYIDTNGEINLNENIVAHYLLNNNSHDCVGTYDGTDTSMTYTGDVAEFNGSTSQSNTGITYDGLNQTFTWSCWAKLNNTDTAEYIMSLYDNSIDNRQYYIRKDDAGNLIIGGFHLSGYDNTATHTTDTFYHLVLVKTATSVLAYVDGAEVGSAIAFDQDVNGVSLFIGAIEGAGGNLDGIMSNVRIYSDAKDSDFVDDLYVEGYYPKPLPLPTTTNLIAHYQLTGTAEDSTGNYDGVETSVTYVDDAEFGSSVDFNGSSSILTIPTLGVQNTYSVTSWIKPDGNSSSDLVHILTALVQADFAFKFQEAQESIYVYTSATGPKITANNTVLLNEWTHVVCTIDGATLKIYANEVEILSTAFTEDLPDTSFAMGSNVNIVEYGSTLQRNTRIYSSALKQQEITDIYNYEKNFRPIDINDGLIAYYPLKNNSKDNYYNEYNGTDTNVTYDGDNVNLVGDDSEILFTGTPATAKAFSFWHKNTNTVLSVLVKITSNSSSTQDALELNTDGRLQIKDYDGNTVLSDTTTIFSDNTNMHHIVVNDTGTELEIFVNNVKLGTTGTYWSFNTVYGIGQTHTVGNSNNINGDVSNFRVYNKSLSVEQIEVIYNTENVDNH